MYDGDVLVFICKWAAESSKLIRSFNQWASCSYSTYATARSTILGTRPYTQQHQSHTGGHWCSLECFSIQNVNGVTDGCLQQYRSCAVVLDQCYNRNHLPVFEDLIKFKTNYVAFLLEEEEEAFLNASSHTYKPVCLSVRPSIWMYVRHNYQKWRK